MYACFASCTVLTKCNQMQVAQGQVLVRICALVKAAIGCCIPLLLVPKVVLTFATCTGCNSSSQKLAQTHNLHSRGGHVYKKDHD